MTTFCTIITVDYMPFAKALFNSLQKFDKTSKLKVLITDSEPIFEKNKNPEIIRLTDISGTRLFKEIERKYAHTNSDFFRWSLKPIFLTWLLENGFEKVIFLDPDIYFVGDYRFLIEKLNTSSILLTPHWSSTDPYLLEESLIYILRNGLYNAGFVGASQKGLDAIRWWTEACHYNIDRRTELGIYVDQKYLDILPVEFSDVEIVRHRGCNIACWNMNSNTRNLINGKLVIKNEFEPVFIHFTKDTIRHIQNLNDLHLQPYLDEYANEFTKQGFQLKNLLKDIDMQEKHTTLKKIKRNLLLKTRFKRWLMKISKRI